MDGILDTSLIANLEYIKSRTGNSTDIIIRHHVIGESPGIPLAIVYIEGLVDIQTVNEFITESIIKGKIPVFENPKSTIESLRKNGITLGNIKITDKWEDLFLSLMGGDTIILVDGVSEIIIAGTRGGETRSIEEPNNQVTVRGPRDGFVESIQTNITLVRRRIKNPNLWIESMQIGKQTQTDVSIMFLNGIANEKVVEEVRRRLKKINISEILESGYIEHLIEDQTYTSFPTMYHTERPDTVAANILEGRIAIFVDGTPYVLLVPAVFIQFFQAVDDYYSRFDIATAVRFLRILTFLLSVITPSVYIAATTFHQEMIPTQLLIVIAAQRENVPFPAFIEALMMEITFEILREAGIRMPRPVGNAISIVGALVIGQAAVQAGIVSPAMVIIVSITAIANFASPSFAMAISARLIRFLFMVLAAVIGFYGVILGIIFLTLHLCSLRSFGVPYMTPLAPVSPSNLQDTFIRTPLWITRRRANLIKQRDLSGEEQPEPKPPKPRRIYKKNSQGGNS
nr:spore germination protein [Bacillus niameyensis]